MTELLSSPSVEFVGRVVLPGLQVVAALLTLIVLALALRWSARGLTRSVTPHVECYLRLRQTSPVFDLVIANFGAGSAYRVCVRLEADEEDFRTHSVSMKGRGTDVPFSLIEPGGEITTMFGSGPKLLGEGSALKPFVATVRYEWRPFWSNRRRSEERRYEIDIRPFRGLVPDWKTDETAKTLRSEIPKIARAIEIRRRPPLPADRRISGVEALRRIERMMPDLFSEIRNDLKSSPLKREFVLLPKMAIYNAGHKEPLAYYFEDHDDLADKVGVLVNEGVVTDITYNNVDRYVMSEALVTYLGQNAVDDEG